MIFLASLVNALALRILTPLYNSYPLTLHTGALDVAKTLILALTYWLWTREKHARDVTSGRVCLSIAALATDAVVVFGRRAGSQSGAILGPQWGALAARFVLGVGSFWSMGMFAMLCMVCKLFFLSENNSRHTGSRQAHWNVLYDDGERSQSLRLLGPSCHRRRS